MKVYLIDTNIFLRYLVKDNQAQAQKINQLFLTAKQNQVKLITTTFIMNEMAWTLKSFYKLNKIKVVEKMELILNFPGIKIRDYFNLKQAVVAYKQKNVDLVDIFTYQTAKKYQAAILSYDRDFDKLDPKIRKEP